MARNTVSVDQIVNDFVLTMDGDDFVAGSSNTVIRNFALRGIREMGFDMLKRVRSLKKASCFLVVFAHYRTF